MSPWNDWRRAVKNLTLLGKLHDQLIQLNLSAAMVAISSCWFEINFKGLVIGQVMKYEKQIVILANSRKPGGRCVAGREFDGKKFGAWIRPVSKRDGEEMSESDRQFENKAEPELLDVVEIPMIKPRPHSIQTENHLIDDKLYWEKTDDISNDEIRHALENPDTLWVNGHRSYHGINDEVPERFAQDLDTSLVLIKVRNLRIKIVRTYTGKKQVRGEFSYNDITYNLVVTDPVVEGTYDRKGRVR